jgi:hypothetical protein
VFGTSEDGGGGGESGGEREERLECGFGRFDRESSRVSGAGGGAGGGWCGGLSTSENGGHDGRRSKGTR